MLGDMSTVFSWKSAAAIAVVASCVAVEASDHWSFRPVLPGEPPAVKDAGWVRSPVDRFILARLELEGMRPSPPADRGAWLRRVSLDLVGLPPTPEQVHQFLADPAPDAEARVVDALLGSPRYGERWAQHWLDVVRFADTHGFEVNTERPNAWPYRDYVIAAFNADLPYDQFIRDQIAGDLRGQDAATGFLVTASVLLPGQIGADDVSKRLARQDALDEIVVNTGQTFLGLSVGCARCHDHKFDPITARDYYSMQAFFAGVEYGDREMRTPEALRMSEDAARMRARVTAIDAALPRFEAMARPGEAGANRPGALRPPVSAARNSDRFAPVRTQRVRFTIRKTTNLEPCIDELEVYDTTARNVALASSGTRVTSSGDRNEPDRHELRFVNDGRYGNSRSWMSSEMGKGSVTLEFPTACEIERVVWGRDRNREFVDRLATDYSIEVEVAPDVWRVVADSTDRHPMDAPAAVRLAGVLEPSLTTAETATATGLLAERKDLEGRIGKVTQAQMAFAGVFRKPDDIRLLHRGDPEQPRDPVVPAVPAVLGGLKMDREAAEPDRRRALADWLADAANPLAARVMVNRIWQGHFGIGLVETSSDFGRSGTKPSHPELLDWLAMEFVRSGWSVKHMHRRIVLSATYRQSSRVDPVAATRDADVRWLWRFPSRRMESEPMRDSMLWVSGRLNLSMGGRGFDLFNNRGGLTGFQPVESYAGDGLKRMIYAHKVRREREAVFGAFDCPDAGQSTARRRESTTPVQALNLFNSRFTVEQCEAFARRVAAEVGPDPAHQLERAFDLALGRSPTSAERADALPVVREHGVAVLARVLFNSNEFLFVP
jgi:Protein of unknown function (DUF1553)/Protein of unknown function (DUF1549)